MDDGNAGPFRKSSRSLAGVKRTYTEQGGSDTDETLLLQLLGDDSWDDPEYKNEAKKDENESSSEEETEKNTSGYSKSGQILQKCSKSDQSLQKSSTEDQSPRKCSTSGQSSQKRSKSSQSSQKCSSQPLPPPLSLPSTSAEKRSKQPMKIDHFFKKGAVTKNPTKMAPKTVPNPFFKPKEPIVPENDQSPRKCSTSGQSSRKCSKSVQKCSKSGASSQPIVLENDAPGPT